MKTDFCYNDGGRSNYFKGKGGDCVTTTIPQERWGVHRTHCCFEHGCKYGDEDCPVKLGLVKQDYPCEMCNDEDDF